VSSIVMEPLWFALSVKPRHEKAVAEALAAQRLEPFVPLYLERRKWSSRLKTVALPLFPGYVFCRFDFRDRFTIWNTRGVIQILGAGKVFEPVSEDQIAALRTVLESGLDMRPYPHLDPGTPVAVTRGPLAGLRGTVSRSRGNSALIITVDVLQRSIVVEVEPDMVEPDVSSSILRKAVSGSASFRSARASA